MVQMVDMAAGAGGGATMTFLVVMVRGWTALWLGKLAPLP